MNGRELDALGVGIDLAFACLAVEEHDLREEVLHLIFVVQAKSMLWLLFVSVARLDIHAERAIHSIKLNPNEVPGQKKPGIHHQRRFDTLSTLGIAPGQ